MNDELKLQMESAKAVILYDCIETMLETNEILAGFPPRSGGDAEWAVSSWRFDMLEQGIEAEKALEETSDVELIILAIGDAGALWDWPEDWLRRWAEGHKTANVTLVVALAGVLDEVKVESALIAPLRRLAELQDMRILVLRDTTPSTGRLVRATASMAIHKCPELTG